MSRIAYSNGAYVRASQAHVSVMDRAFLFADGVYEVFWVKDGALVDEQRHFDRLERSLEKVRIVMPMARSALRLVVREVLRRNRIAFGNVYLQITRGAPGVRDHGFPAAAVRPTVVAFARHANERTLELRAQKGLNVITTPETRWAACDIKSTALLANVLAKQAAYEAGAQEAWFVDGDGFITEGASSNAWIVTAAGVVKTRALSANILAGVTRAHLLELLNGLGIAVEEAAFSVAEAYAAREAFQTSAMSVVAPVVRIDGRAIGDATPGALTLRLRELYRQAATATNKR